MRSSVFICLLIAVLTVAKGKTSFYGIDIGDGNDLQLYKRVQSSAGCLIFQAEALSLDLVFTDGKWKIFQNLKSWYSTCVANGGQILYHQQEGDRPTSEGWYDHRKNTSDVILSVYALEECKIYKGAYINSERFWQNLTIPNGNMDSCLKNAFSSDFQQSILVTTKSQLDVSNNTVCTFGQIDIINSGTIVLSSDDEEAQIFLGEKICYNDQIITMHISEAKLHNENLKMTNSTEMNITWLIPLVVVLFLLSVTVVVVIFLVKKRRKHSEEAIEMNIHDSKHIIFKKQERNLLKSAMNSKIKQKEKIFTEFKKLTSSINQDCKHIVDKGKKKNF